MSTEAGDGAGIRLRLPPITSQLWQRRIFDGGENAIPKVGKQSLLHLPVRHRGYLGQLHPHKEEYRYGTAQNNQPIDAF